MSGQYELIINPDTEALLVQMLTEEPRIQNYSPSVTVSASVVGYTNELTWVQLYRSGGISQWPMPDVATIYFNVFSPDRKHCRDLAALVQGLMHSNLGTAVGSPGAGMRITNVTNQAGLAWLPDPSGLPRYTFSVQVSARPY